MTTTTNEQIALRVLELMSAGDRDAPVEDLIHPDFVEHRLALRGPDGFREAMRRVNTTFADIEITPVDVIAASDKVVARTRIKALHVGPFPAVGADQPHDRDRADPHLAHPGRPRRRALALHGRAQPPAADGRALGHERFFRLVGRPIQSLSIQPHEAEVPDMRQLAAAAAEADFEVLGPPPFDGQQETEGPSLR